MSLNEKNQKDLTEESQNELLNLPLVCADKVMKNKKSSEKKLRSLYKSPIVKSSLLPENVTIKYTYNYIKL